MKTLGHGYQSLGVEGITTLGHGYQSCGVEGITTLGHGYQSLGAEGITMEFGCKNHTEYAATIYGNVFRAVV